MRVEAKRGYYISSSTQGGAEGPLADSLNTRQRVLGDLAEKLGFYGPVGTRIMLEYGKPVKGKFEPNAIVDPIERVYTLLRYSDPATKEIVFISPHPKKKDGSWEPTENYKPVLATPELSYLFDELLPSSNKASDVYQELYNRIYYEALEKAGLTEEDRPQQPGSKARKKTWEKFWKDWEAHLGTLMPDALRSPRPYWLRVEGIDKILRSIDAPQRAKKRRRR